MNDMINKYKYLIKDNVLKITEPQLSSFQFVDQLNFKKLILNCYDKSQYKTHIKFALVPLNITKLVIEDCALESISGIRQMTQLIELDLNTNRVEDVSDLQYLVNLVNISMGDNRVSDISGFRHLLKLKELDFGKNYISDVYALKYAVNLKILRMWRNFIVDIEPLKDLKHLTKVDLTQNCIFDVNLKDFRRQQVFILDQQDQPSQAEINNAHKLKSIYKSFEILILMQKQRKNFFSALKLVQRNQNIKMGEQIQRQIKFTANCASLFSILNGEYFQ
ncbi:Conserved_hypothetical protein [Hexamita inflata]|uniref:Uncharacterized protein n=1 Tax=Hexamita inflata TaxID=28002 RepID=A0AA86RBY1_9EUKA|nr:Conserved hypothetical protein [Hexamita inflata]